MQLMKCKVPDREHYNTLFDKFTGNNQTQYGQALFNYEIQQGNFLELSYVDAEVLHINNNFDVLVKLDSPMNNISTIVYSHLVVKFE